MNLVLATVEDLKNHKIELIEMMNYSLQANHGGALSKKGVDVYEKLLYYFDLDKAKVWLALDNQKVIGYAQFFKKDSERVHLNEIAVAKDYQNKGIGSMLIEAVEQSAKEFGVSVVELFCNEVNDNAKHFYDTHQYSAEKHLMVKPV